MSLMERRNVTVSIVNKTEKSNREIYIYIYKQKKKRNKSFDDTQVNTKAMDY